MAKFKTLLVIMSLFAFSCLLAGFMFGLRFSYGGYYNRGIITLYPNKMADANEYDRLSWHEYGHYVYQYKFIKGDLLVWKKIVDKCGFEGENAKLYNSKSVKYDEEFADAYSSSRRDGLGFCNEKLVFAYKY